VRVRECAVCQKARCYQICEVHACAAIAVGEVKAEIKAAVPTSLHIIVECFSLFF